MQLLLSQKAVAGMVGITGYNVSMLSPRSLWISGAAYNMLGGAPGPFGPVSEILLRDAPDFGPALVEIEIYFHFRTEGPPRQTLERLYENFHRSRGLLPKTVFYRSRQKATISVASELVEGGQWDRREIRITAAGLRNAVAETIGALRLLGQRITKKDAFAFADFIRHCEERAKSLPDSDQEALALAEAAAQRDEADRAAMSPWEKLGIDWRDYHPEARTLLDDPFFWDCTNDFSPHGNDTGADLLEDYRKWLKRNPEADPTTFYQSLLQSWGLPADGPKADVEENDKIAVAIAFAEIKLTSSCHPNARQLAEHALQRQRLQAEQDVRWPHRQERLDSLAKLLESLEAAPLRVG